MFKNKKLISALAVLLSSACLLAGCGGPAKQENASPITYPEDGSVYPMVCEDELTLWSSSLGSGTDLNTSPIGLAWQEQTGAKVKFEQPVGGMESLNTLLASGDLPDIICTDLTTAPGGIGKMVEDEVIIALDEYIDAYAPNLKKVLEENPEMAKEIRSDDGHYYFFPLLKLDDRLNASQGLALRKDMLDKAGLDVPHTIDEWTEVLRAFKEQGATAPLSYNFDITEMNGGFFTGAWNVKGEFYVDNDVIKWGFMEDGMKDAIAQFKAWYDEGLLDRNIVQVADLDGQIFQGDTAATSLWAGSGMGKYLNSKPSPEFDLVPARAAVLNEGDVSNFGGKTRSVSVQTNGYITTECKNIELAVRFLDYAYGEAGHLLVNFGIEGESYTMVDGKPTYTDKIIKPENGKSITEAMKPYIFAWTSGPIVQDYGYLEQYYQLPQQKAATALWAQDNGDSTRLPILQFTTEESDRLAELTTNIRTYSVEMFFKFIAGSESLDNYDKFREQLKSYGVEEALEIYQAAYDRYLKR